MDAKIKHLEFIQAAINRMAGNSFLLKGWAVTLTGGLLALTFRQIDRRYLFISFAVLLLFWSLDGYFLSRERRFISLYGHGWSMLTLPRACLSRTVSIPIEPKQVRSFVPWHTISTLGL